MRGFVCRNVAGILGLRTGAKRGTSTPVDDDYEAGDEKMSLYFTGDSRDGAAVDTNGRPADPRRPDGRRERSQASTAGRRQVRRLHDEARRSAQEPHHGEKLLRPRPGGRSTH